MVDLCCGRFGWGKGFVAQGWRVRGYDLKRPDVIPDGCEFVKADILSLTLADVADADFVCCSSPCEQFSVHCMKHFHPNPPYPAKGIELFIRGQFLCGGKPHVMENVRCAERFVGRSVNHCGPFYLWGNAVPGAFPSEIFAIGKGNETGGPRWQTMTPAQKKEARRGFPCSMSKPARKATLAEIPLSLSTYIAECATRLVGGGAWVGQRLGSA